MNIHHRPSGADGVADPIPGFLAGGPNGSAVSYEDVTGNHTTNEIAINWNASLTALLAGLETAYADKASQGQ